MSLNSTILTSKRATKELRLLLRSAVDTERGLKFGSLTDLKFYKGSWEFVVKVSMRSPALAAGLEVMKARGFDDPRYRTKMRAMSTLFHDRNTAPDLSQWAKGDRSQLDFDMKVATEATRPLRDAFRKIIPSALFNPIEFVGSTKGFVTVVFEGEVSEKELVDANAFGIEPEAKPTGGKRKKKPTARKPKGESHEEKIKKSLTVARKIISSLELGIEEEVSGGSAVNLENSILEGDGDGTVENVVDQAGHWLSSSADTFSMIPGFVFGTEYDRVEQRSEWRQMQQGDRFGGKKRRIPGRILSAGENPYPISVFAEMIPDLNRFTDEPMERGSVQWWVIIYIPESESTLYEGL